MKADSYIFCGAVDALTPLSASPRVCAIKWIYINTLIDQISVLDVSEFVQNTLFYYECIHWKTTVQRLFLEVIALRCITTLYPV